MAERAGVSCILSVLIVALATVILHRVERRGEVAAIPGPIPRKSPGSRPSRTDKPPPQAAKRPEPEPSTVAKTVAAPVTAPPPRPSSPFTRVQDGESLVDLVRRVYGPKAAVEDVWKLNRDQLESPASPLRPGMLLRTPDL